MFIFCLALVVGLIVFISCRKKYLIEWGIDIGNLYVFTGQQGSGKTLEATNIASREYTLSLRANMKECRKGNQKPPELLSNIPIRLTPTQRRLYARAAGIKLKEAPKFSGILTRRLMLLNRERPSEGTWIFIDEFSKNWDQFAHGDFNSYDDFVRFIRQITLGGGMIICDQTIDMIPYQIRKRAGIVHNMLVTESKILGLQFFKRGLFKSKRVDVVQCDGVSMPDAAETPLKQSFTVRRCDLYDTHLYYKKIRHLPVSVVKHCEEADSKTDYMV